MSNSSRRLNSGSEYYRSSQTYVSGNTVRKLEPQERRVRTRRTERSDVQVRRSENNVSEMSESVRQNREKAMQMNRGYVLFLAAISIIVLGLCVNYLRLRSQLTTQLKSVANQESELSTLKADNDALYNAVIASVDLDEVRERAIGELGMQYPTEEQIVEFDTDGSSYVRQYQNVPDAK